MHWQFGEMKFGEMKRNTSNWSNFGMLLRRAGLTASAGLSCLSFVIGAVVWSKYSGNVKAWTSFVASNETFFSQANAAAVPDMPTLSSAFACMLFVELLNNVMMHIKLCNVPDRCT